MSESDFAPFHAGSNPVVLDGFEISTSDEAVQIRARQSFRPASRQLKTLQGLRGVLARIIDAYGLDAVAELLDFAPFQGEGQALTLGDLEVENRVDEVAIYGTLELQRDVRGHRFACILHNIVQAVEQHVRDLPLDPVTESAADIRTVKNPFA